MHGVVQSFRAEAEAQATELLRAIDTAETVIVSTIERECEALRAGRMLAAHALRLRLKDAARLYIDVTRAARASMWTIEQILPGTRYRLEECRSAFAALLRIELAALAAERAAATTELHLSQVARTRPSATVTPIEKARRRRQRLRRAG